MKVVIVSFSDPFKFRGYGPRLLLKSPPILDIFAGMENRQIRRSLCATAYRESDAFITRANRISRGLCYFAASRPRYFHFGQLSANIMPVAVPNVQFVYCYLTSSWQEGNEIAAMREQLPKRKKELEWRLHIANKMIFDTIMMLVQKF